MTFTLSRRRTSTSWTAPPTTPASPVTGDIIDCTIETHAGGMTYAKVTIKGFTTGATYAFGMGTNNDPSAAKMVFNVRSEGYDATGTPTTIDRVLYGTRVMRKAYPNEASLDETVSGSDLIIKVALSEVIYDDDKNGGAGTSGRNPTITTLSGWATNTGGGSQSATAVYLSCTNNSTSDYRVPFGQWDIITHQRVTADFRMAFTPRHTHGIACCVFTALGATSSVSSSQTTTAMSSRLRSASGLYGEAHQITMDVDQFTQGERIDLRCRVYPTVGDTIFDTDNYTTANEECRNFNKIVAYCDKTNTPNIAVVSTTGNDGTAVTSTTLATANASPYATMSAAFTALGTGGGIMYLKAGNHNIAHGGSTITNTFWTEILPYPGESSSTVSVTVDDFRLLRTYRIKLGNITYKLGANTRGCYGNGSNFLWFSGVAFDENGFQTTGQSIYEGFLTTYLTDCTNMKLDKWGYCGNLAGFRAAILDGNVMTGTSSVSFLGAYRAVANACVGVGIGEKGAANTAPTHDGVMYEHNRLWDWDTNGTPVVLYNAANTIGASICGNIMEMSQAGSSNAFSLQESNATASSNIICEHNTVPGERANVGYNETGSTAVPHLGWSFKNNALEEWNNKDDTFGTPNANRTGSWAVGYGVNFAGNRYQGTLFPGEFDGLYTDITATPSYTDDNSGTGDGTGSGNYAPTGGSDLIGTARPSQVKFDLYGTAVSNDVGAIQV